MERTATGYGQNRPAVQTSGGEKPAENRVELIRQGLVQLLERSEMIDDRLNRLCNRAFGGSESDVGKSTPEQVPNGALQSLETMIEKLHAACGSQESHISRLDQMV